jgi:hypothetical protein
VLIERVRPPAAVARDGGAPALEVQFQVHFGSAQQLCHDFAARCRDAPAALLGDADAEVHALLGLPDADTATAVCEDVSAGSDAGSGKQPPTAGEAAIAEARRAANESRVVPARPLTEMELPYKMYRVCAAVCSCQHRHAC